VRTSDLTFQHPSSITDGHGAVLVNLLLRYGARADVSDKLGRTALHNAALAGNEEAVQALLKAGANVDTHFHIKSLPKQNFDNYCSLDSETTVDVESKKYTSGFKVSRTGDNTAENMDSVLLGCWVNFLCCFKRT
jgi:ankyrin repeat protein